MSAALRHADQAAPTLGQGMADFALADVQLLPGPGLLGSWGSASVYGHDDCTLLINRYVPSVLHWARQGLRLRQLGSFPGPSGPQLLVQQAPRKRLTLRLRHPEGCALMQVRLNGRRHATSQEPGTCVDITRQWRQGDEVRLELAAHAQGLSA